MSTVVSLTVACSPRNIDSPRSSILESGNCRKLVWDVSGWSALGLVPVLVFVLAVSDTQIHVHQYLRVETSFACEVIMLATFISLIVAFVSIQVCF